MEWCTHRCYSEQIKHSAAVSPRIGITVLVLTLVCIEAQSQTHISLEIEI